MQGKTVECKIYGGYWHLKVLATDGEMATVQLPEYNGRVNTRELPILSEKDSRGVDSCVIVG